MAELQERDAELAALQAALARARAGAGGVVVVGGEAGIGKSALVAAFLATVPDDVRVLAGACDDLLAARALAPLREAVRTVPGPLAAALDGPSAAVPDAAEAQLALRPTVLVVDDLHWADDATLDVLRHLARRVARLPALLVLAVRPEALTADHPVQGLLGSLAGGPVVHLDLAPLSPAAVGRLAGARDGAARSRGLHRVTGGNPFFVTESLATPPGRLPESVAEAVTARVAQLPERTVAAVERLSVVPTPVDPLLAKALLGEDVAALAEAEQRGVVEVRPGGLAFRHELARRAVEAGLPPLRRRALHADVVAALRELGATDPERLVHHAVAAGDADTVLQFAPEAARAAVEGGSHRQALAHLEAASVHADRLEPRARARLVDALGWQLYTAQRFDEAVATGRRALALVEGLDDPAWEAAAAVRLSRYLLLAGEPVEAEEHYDRAVALLDADAPVAARAELAAHGAALAVLTARFALAVPRAEAAVALATEAGAPEHLALALAYRGLVRAAQGRPVEGEADVRAGLALAVEHRCDEAVARIQANLINLLAVVGDREGLAALVPEARAYCAERGLLTTRVLFDLQQHLQELWSGDWDAAERGLAALRAQTRSNPTAFRSKVDAWYGRLLARRGAPEAAPVVRAAWDEARRIEHPVALLYAGLALAEWGWLAGDGAAVDEVADALLPVFAGSATWSTPRAELERILARAGRPVAPVADAAPGSGSDPYERALDLGLSDDPDAMLEGWAALEALGARAPAELVRRALQERGVTRLPRPRPAADAPRPNPFGLTARQLDVLDRVAGRATNAEIAQELGLSVRTVDHHVSAILARLGVGSRREAAARALGVGG